MAYRLTDASALGLDLARTPGGVEAAGVLLRVLLAAPHDVRTPVRARADLTVFRVRARDLLGPDSPTVVDLTSVDLTSVDLTSVEDPAQARRATDRVEAAGGAGSHDGRDATDGSDRADGADDAFVRRLHRLARRLGAVSFGSVSDLLRLGSELSGELSGGLPEGPGRERSGGPVRGPVGDLPDVVTDALLAALVRTRDDPSAPLLALSLGHRLDPPAPAPPALPVLLPPGRALLAIGDSPVVVATAGLLERVTAAREAVLLLEHRPAPHVWAEHMHSTAWAVETTGRTRLAAAAQLELLRCLDAAGVSGGAYLGGVWNSCSAAVQAQVVADVLPADSHEVLCADLLAALPG